MLYLATIHSLLMLILSLFAAHRLLMVLHFARLRNQSPSSDKHFSELPFVTVQLPIYNEREVAPRLIANVIKIDYPRDRFEVQVLDDSNDGSSEMIKQLINSYANKGIIIEHITREDREGFKAGALAHGLKSARGEFVAVFDADFVPQKSFLLNTINYFCDKSVGMVQCCWGHINRSYSFLTRAQAVLLDGHFYIEHTVRNRSGCFFNFNGTAGIWRKSTISQAGGWQGDTLTEDLDLSYRAQIKGARFIYLVDEEVPAELPVEIDAFKSQQHRWTKGAIQVLDKLGTSIFRSDVSFSQKREAFFHLAANFCYPILLLAGLLMLPALEILNKAEFPLPPAILVSIKFVFIGAFAAIFIFYLTAARSAKQRSTMLDVLLAIITGIALSLSNSIAVIEAVVGKKTDFLRTPKTGALPNGSANNSRSRATWRPWLVYLELSLAVYFAISISRAIYLGRYETLVFAVLFFVAFSYFAILGLVQLARNYSSSLTGAEATLAENNSVSSF